MGEIIKNIQVDKYEYGLIVNSLREMKNNSKDNEVLSNAISDLILKIIDTPTKKRTFKLGKSERGKTFIGQTR